MLQAGIYQATKISHAWTTANTGTVGLVIKLEIADGFGVTDLIYGTIWISEKAKGIARSQFKAMGHDPDVDDIVSFDDPEYLNGRQFEVTLEEEVWKGETRLKVARIGASSKPKPEALQQAQKMMRDAKKKTATKEQEPQADPPKPTVKEQSKPPEQLVDADGDDIPF